MLIIISRVRSGVEGDQLTNMRDIMDSCSISSQVDRWYCDFNGEGEFMVKDVRNLLDEAVLPHVVILQDGSSTSQLKSTYLLGKLVWIVFHQK